MKRISLENLAAGGVAERIDHELAKVLENLADPNTDHKKARKMKIELVFKANEKRDVSVVAIKANSTLAPARDLETSILIDRDINTGHVVGAELISGMRNQMMIDNDGDVADDTGQKLAQVDHNVVNLRSKGS